MRGFVFHESVKVTTDPERPRYATITVECRKLWCWGMFVRREVCSVELSLSGAVSLADELTRTAMRGYASSGGRAS